MISCVGSLPLRVVGEWISPAHPLAHDLKQWNIPQQNKLIFIIEHPPYLSHMVSTIDTSSGEVK
jgi:hypothetical protein